jgi:sulfur carrier protein
MPSSSTKPELPALSQRPTDPVPGPAPTKDAGADAPVETVQVNGRSLAFAGGALLDVLVALNMEARTGMAVALNDRVVPRSQWPQQAVSVGDRITLITATAGG